jgi:uncharacterized protein
MSKRQRMETQMSDTEDQKPETGPESEPQSVPNPEPVVEQTASDGPSAEERQWGMIAHISALVGFVIPFGNIIGPLIVWQMKKNDMPFVERQGKEALNFQITVTIAFFVCILLSFILIGFLLMPVVGIGALVLAIIAAIQANQGVEYQYPINWRLVT